jgi:hypothetical protein
VSDPINCFHEKTFRILSARGAILFSIKLKLVANIDRVFYSIETHSWNSTDIEEPIKAISKTQFVHI